MWQTIKLLIHLYYKISFFIYSQPQFGKMFLSLRVTVFSGKSNGGRRGRRITNNHAQRVRARPAVKENNMNSRKMKQASTTALVKAARKLERKAKEMLAEAFEIRRFVNHERMDSGLPPYRSMRQMKRTGELQRFTLQAPARA